jgi:prepilin-type N-terminal cleavage/methylation domain-containing protein
MRRAFTLIELLVVIAIIAVLLALVNADAMVAFLIGWVRYPLRLMSERSVDWPAVILCAACLAGLTVGVHGFGRWFAGSRPQPTVWPWSRTFKLIGLMLLMFSAGIAAIGVTHQIVWLATTKERLTQGSIAAAHAVQARNNMKQLAIASQSHDDESKTLPAGATFDANGRALHGWQTALLPYIEHGQLHGQIDLAAPWNAPANARLFKQEVALFMHPYIGTTNADADFAPSHFAGNIHVLGARPLALKDITDGTSNTLLFGEVAYDIKPWGMPLNCRDPALGLNVPHGFANPMGRDVVFAFADGSVRSIRTDIAPHVLKALSTPKGGEKVDGFDW